MMNETKTDAGTKPEAIFMVGGPGSGKSFIRERDFGNLKVLDCDAIKAAHPDYDPKNPGALHAWSAQELVRAFFGQLSTGGTFVLDGTGTNVDKYVSWITSAREAGFRTVVVYVRCSLNVALARNASRDRVVPESIVTSKHAQVEEAFRILSGAVDEARIIDNN